MNNKFRDPKWLKHVPPSHRERFKEKLAERELIEARKQLFNAEKPKISVSAGKNEPGLRKLRQTYDPTLPNPSLPRLIAHCWKNMQEWRKEREEKDKKI